MCRLHALLAELAPGGIAKEMYVSDGERFLANITPETPVEQVRYDMALELLDDVRRLDEQTKESHRRIRVAVKASGTSLTEIYGVGPIIAAQLIGYAGDVRRFANRDTFASYNGTAPVEFASGGRVVHRVSQRGNRRLNHALHMAAVTQIRNPGTADASTSSARSPRARPRRKPFARSSARSATPSTDSSSSTPDRGSGRTPRDDSCLRDRLFTLRDRLFGEVTPEPIETLRRRVLPRQLDSSRLDVPQIGVLTQRGFGMGQGSNVFVWTAKPPARAPSPPFPGWGPAPMPRCFVCAALLSHCGR